MRITRDQVRLISTPFLQVVLLMSLIAKPIVFAAGIVNMIDTNFVLNVINELSSVRKEALSSHLLVGNVW